MYINVGLSKMLLLHDLQRKIANRMISYLASCALSGPDSLYYPTDISILPYRKQAENATAFVAVVQ